MAKYVSILRGETIIQEPTEKSKEKLKNFIDLAGVIIVALNREGNITLMNKKGYEILAYDEGELIGKNWFDVCIPPENREELKNAFRALINGDEEPFEFYTNTVLTKKGDQKIISWQNTLLHDNDGNIIASLSSGEDITELTEIEEKLRESQEQMTNLFNSIPIGIHMYHLYDDGRLVFIGANPAADEILKVDNMKFVGQTIEEAFPPLSETEIPERYRETAAEGKEWKTERIDYVHEEIKGAFEVQAFQISPMYMVATFRDITERLKTEEQFKQKIIKLEEKIEELSK